MAPGLSFGAAPGLSFGAPAPNGQRCLARFLLGGVGGAASLPPCPPWLNSQAGTEPRRRRGGVRLMLNRVNLT